MNLAEIRSRLADNLVSLEARICAACMRANRTRDEVTLIAVTKYVETEIAALLPELGVLDLGESRPQELWRKAAAIPGVRWHMIGHLQRNKVAPTIGYVHVIHSVDSERLLAAISDDAERQDLDVDVLLEINLSRESNKHGFSPEHDWFCKPGFGWKHPRVHPRGLMTMAAISEDAEESRLTFRELRELRETVAKSWPDVGPQMQHLSMGMTGDFEVALEEGATMVRIGSALFEGIVA